MQKQSQSSVDIVQDFQEFKSSIKTKRLWLVKA